MFPSAWSFERLGDVAELQRGFDLPSAKRVEGEVPIVSSGGVTGCHNEAKVKAPGIVTGRYGSIGDVFYIERDFWPLNTSLWVKDFHGNYPKYIYFLLSNFDFKKFSDKTGVPGVNRNDLHAVKVGVPPLPEQRKIAKILSTWDKAIVTTEKLIATSKQQKKALMQQLLTGKKRLVNSETGRVFEGAWEEIRVKDVVKSLDAGVSVNSEDDNDVNSEFKILKTSCVSLGVFDGEKAKSVKEALEVKRLKEPVLSNSIIISRMNTPLLVGANAYIKLAPKNTFLPDRLWQVKVKNELVDVCWLGYWFSSSQTRYLLRSNATGTSGSMKNITKPDVMSMRLSFPTLPEQQKIAQVLTAADKEVENLESKLTHFQQEKKALMQQLLTGKRRVKVEDTEAA